MERPPPSEGIDGRGTDLGRLVGLSDGVFAFAMTLLVINLALPAISGTTSPTGVHQSASDFLHADEGPLLGYVLAFFIVAAWWSGHHRIFSAIRRYDATLLQLNNLFLLLVSITPFTLAVVFAFGPSKFTDTSLSAKEAIVLFAVMQSATGAVLLAIWKHATGGHLLVDASLPMEWIKFAEQDTGLRVVVFGISILVALVNPLLAEIIWAGVLVGRRRSKPPSAPGSTAAT